MNNNHIFYQILIVLTLVIIISGCNKKTEDIVKPVRQETGIITSSTNQSKSNVTADNRKKTGEIQEKVPAQSTVIKQMPQSGNDIKQNNIDTKRNNITGQRITQVQTSAYEKEMKFDMNKTVVILVLIGAFILIGLQVLSGRR
jgi:hypothetical protein